MRLRKGQPAIQVHALPETIDALRTHLFNGVIWPDFTRLPSAEAPVLRMAAFEIGQIITLGERRIEVLPAAHTVPAVGFAVLGAPVAKRGAFIYTGDTGPNPALWTRLHGMRISSLVIETAFRDEERQLARVSRHLCPSALGQELARLDHPVNVFITHIKPGELDVVMTEIAALGSPHRIRALAQDQVIAIE
jgi:cAMP phosphodiesterase